MGVTTKKKTKPITMGDIIFPSNIPNLIHNLFKYVNKLGLIMVIMKNIKDNIIDQILITPPDFNGYKPIIRKKIKNNIPKVILSLGLILTKFFMTNILT
jgi:hypothetical protein